MIKQIKQYMKKYHDANLWIGEEVIREDKKRAIETEEIVHETVAVTKHVAQYPYTVFSHADVGHDKEETNKIQQLYKELAEVFIPRTWAM